MRQIYADYNATQPISKAHFEELGRILFQCDANPSSSHGHGLSAKVWLEKSRSALAKTLGASKSEIYFTSGGTESNNLVIAGLLERTRQNDKGAIPHVVTSRLEHASVYDPLCRLERLGACRITYLTPNRKGELSVADLLEALRPETKLIALMLANNEIGNIYPIAQFAEAVHRQRPDIHFHCDAVQAFGKIDVADALQGSVDSLSLSGHKIGGLKGVGALYLKAEHVIEPQQLGGGQECGLRPGTHNMPGIVSLGLRCQALQELRASYDRVSELKQLLCSRLAGIRGLELHGDIDNSLRNTVNFHIDGVVGSDLMLAFEEMAISVSSGSACSSVKGPKSRVLAALGYGEPVIGHSVRISLGPESQEADIDAISSCLKGLGRKKAGFSA